MKKRRILALVSSLAVFGAVLLTGCHQDAAIDRDKAITTDQARQIALQHAGAQADTVTVKDRDIDFDNGKVVYGVEFVADGIEYDYDVDAQTGKVLKAEKDRDDDQKPAESKPQQSSYISKDKAKQIALQHAGISADGVVHEKTEPEKDDGKVVFEVDFYKDGFEYDYEIDAISGKVLKAEIERDDDQKPAESKPQQSSYISKDKARQIALQHAGISADGVVYEKVELEKDDGRVVYEIEFYKNYIEYEYEIDAQSGKVLDYDIDRD